MAKPIKDRGIRWTEQYGDKSAYLKREMEEQIGPGAYFRWEGHDATTGNDYYVVVSPSYSKKKGYHFFAGLRKMPADHGASGKEFNSMREALNYAYDMWRVPKPDTMPPGWVGYNTGDISGKDIVTEGSHEASSNREVKVSGLTVQPESTDGRIEQTGMSVQTMQSQFDPRLGPRVTSEQYCFAYAASPVSGFLPALYSRMRFTGVDGQNFDPNATKQTINLLRPDEESIDETTGKKKKKSFPIPGDPSHETMPNERPPRLATCQEPNEQEFQKFFTQGSIVSERLYDMPKRFPDLSKGNKPWYYDPDNYLENEHLYPEFKSPFGSTPDGVNDENPDVQTNKWGNMDIKMKVSVPRKASNDEFMEKWNSIFLDAYRQSLMGQRNQIASKTIRNPNDPNNAMPHPDLPLLDQKIQDAGKMEKAIMEMVPRQKKKAEPGKAQISGNLGPRTYEILFKARDIGLYDKFTESLGGMIQEATGMEHKVTGWTNITAVKNFMDLYRRSQEIIASGNDSLIQKYGLEDGFNFDQIYHQSIKLKGSQMIVYDDQGMPMALAVDQFAPGDKNWRQEAKLKTPGNRYVIKDPIALIDRTVPGYAQARDRGDENAAAEMLHEFKIRASQNKVQISAQDVYDARTVAPLLTNPKTQVPNTDQYRLPTTGDHKPVDLKSMTGMDSFSYREDDLTQPYYVEATREKIKAQNGQMEDVYTARYFDPKMNSFVYGRIPGETKLDVKGRQMMNGVPTITSNAKMSIMSPSGEPYYIDKNEFTIYDTNSKGKFIPGDSYDIWLGPKGVSPAGWHKQGINAPGGFEIRERAQRSRYDPEKNDYMVRRQSSDLFTSDLVKPSDDYGIDPDSYAVPKGSGYTYTDNFPLMLYLKDKLNLQDNVIKPFTRMTMMDLKVIHEKAMEGAQFYRDNQQRFDQYADRNDVPPEELADYEKYVYGRTVSNCKGESVPNEVFRKMAEELADPEAAFRPKEGELWGLWATPPEGVQAEQHWVTAEQHGVLLAANEKEAQLDMQRSEIRDYLKEGWAIEARPYVRPDGRSIGMPSVAVSNTPDESFVYGAEQMTQYLATDYVPNGVPLQSSEDLIMNPDDIPEDPESLDAPEEAEVPEEKLPPGEELAPGPHGVPPVTPQPLRPNVLPQTDQPPVPTVPMEQPPMPPPTRPKTPTPTMAPKAPVKPFVDLDELFGAVDRLTKMADYFDSKGRTVEADKVDMVMKKLASRKNNA